LQTQLKALQLVPAFKNVHIFRPGYAIEYDFFDPTQLTNSLETKHIKNLFFAGQINGTTGYEEAAGQGLIAGINAHINCHGGNPFVLHRDEAYIGVLIDDLITKGVDEPYRMFTSRAEYRILLRQDNADERLTKRSYDLGLATAYRLELLQKKEEEVNRLINFVSNFSIKADKINPFLEKMGTSKLNRGVKLIDLINRPQLDILSMANGVSALKEELDNIKDRKEEVIESADIMIKYDGYIKREKMMADKITRLEDIRIKDKFNYQEIQSLSTEARQKLSSINPETIAQASRIPGVSPNDISVLLILLGR
jgi:tRNA uridine 5-carboxymethylaminomethyl modification enzyme